MKKETKTKIAKTLKITILYGSFCILAGGMLDYAILKAIYAVQLPQNAPKCEMRYIEPQTATTTLETAIAPKKQGTGKIVEVTAYNSVEAQTDGNPCVGADGTNLCERYEKGECLVATNGYKMGSKLNIDKFGECTVADRMNSRYKNRIDIFMNKEITRAINFGVQRLMVAEIE